MTFKKLIIILTVAVTALTVTLLGTSYAWYTFNDAVTEFNNVETLSNDLDLAVLFVNDDNISTTVGVPILSSEVAEKSSKTLFSITPSSSLLSGKEVAFKISLINLSIDSALTSVTDLKYSLLETVNDTTTTIASGNFQNQTSNTLELKAMTKIPTANLDKTYSYEFRLWLEDNGCTLEQVNAGTCEDQNDLMGKSISGKIKVSTAVR